MVDLLQLDWSFMLSINTNQAITHVTDGKLEFWLQILILCEKPVLVIYNMPDSSVVSPTPLFGNNHYIGSSNVCWLDIKELSSDSISVCNFAAVDISIITCGAGDLDHLLMMDYLDILLINDQNALWTVISKIITVTNYDQIFLTEMQSINGSQ